MSKRTYDDSFRKMAVDLSHNRGSVKEVADEHGINDSLLSKWRQRDSGSKQSPVALNPDKKTAKGA
ncbi:transposase [Pedobacter sp. CG_S7]|uniref:transposase n=1 Tax=Pedobacter sp. CG_S7 TaxID=3143930 RepID=UPI003395F5D5